MSDDSSLLLDVEEPCAPPLEEEVVEVPLLLPARQASILETVAHQHGLTAGAMVRHLLHDFLADTTVRRSQVAR